MQDAELVKRLSWSASSMSASDANAYWSDVVCETIAHVAVTVMDEVPLAARVEHVGLGDIGLTTAVSGSVRVVHTRRLIARDDQERVLVHVQTAGRCLVSQNGRTAALLPGTMTVLDSSRPYSVELYKTSSMVVVQVPRKLLPGRSLADATALDFTGRGPGRLVADFLIGLDRMQRDNPAAAATLVPHAVGLLEAVLDSAAPAAGTASGATALARERIHRFVREHIQLRSLDAASVAAACGLSRRTLFRALADDEESLTGLIRRLRVERASRLLRDRPDLQLPIVAAQSGFGGATQLHRAFQTVLGMSPGTYRTMARDTAPLGGAGRG
jgi:AraC-like DNA-binding protein